MDEEPSEVDSEQFELHLERSKEAETKKDFETAHKELILGIEGLKLYIAEHSAFDTSILEDQLHLCAKKATLLKTQLHHGKSHRRSYSTGTNFSQKTISFSPPVSPKKTTTWRSARARKEKSSSGSKFLTFGRAQGSPTKKNSSLLSTSATGLFMYKEHLASISEAIPPIASEISLSEFARSPPVTPPASPKTTRTFTPRKLKKNQITLQELLKDNEGTQVFLKFLTKERSAENLTFVMEVEKFKTSKKQRERKNCFNNLVKNYVSPTAKIPINISGGIRNKILAQAEKTKFSEVDVTIFDEAVDIVLHLMATDSFKRFLRSSLYTTFSNK